MGLFEPLTTARQREFYDQLSSGRVRRGVVGIDRRFSPEVALRSPSFRKYFLDLIEPILDRSMSVVDIGCGTGMYFPLVAPLVRSLTGIELSRGFAELARENIRKYRLDNAAVLIQDSTRLGFRDGAADAVLCVDSLHHIYDLESTLREIQRIVRPGGPVIVIEPNVVNPVLMGFHLLDRNEWGAVTRCFLGRYRRRFERHFDVVDARYLGLVIGPGGPVTFALADFMLSRWVRPVLGPFSPKLFFHLRNRGQGT